MDALRPLLLAAGQGSRYRGETHKLHAIVRGRPVLQWAIEHAHEADLGPVLVVAGAVSPDPAWLPPGTEVVLNPLWAQGQASSLRCGLVAAGPVGAVVVGLGDQPFLSPEAWRAVAAAPSPIAVATYGGRRGNPVRLDRTIWDLLPADGDEGARPLMRDRPELVLEVPCPGDPADIDALEDLQRWNS